jgi:hypothetical protein
VILIDTNLWLYAALQETPQHGAAKAWMESVLNGEESIALPWSVVLAVLRISTQSRLMLHPLSPDQAMELVETWLHHPLVAVVQPGPSQWGGFVAPPPFGFGVPPGPQSLGCAATPAAGSRHSRQPHQRCPPGGPRHRARLHPVLSRQRLPPLSRAALPEPAHIPVMQHPAST